METQGFAPAWLTARPIAHRGFHDWRSGVGENTLDAFEAAAGRGYAIECDLQISRDGEAMVFHDDTLRRVTEGDGLVKDFTRAELQRMVFRHSRQRMPTLAELLSLVAGKVPLVIEIKSHWDRDFALVRRSLALLQDYPGPYSLMSFDPDIVEDVRRCSPRTARGFISDRGLDPYYNRLPPVLRNELRTLGCIKRMQPHYMSLSVEALPWAPVTALRQRGMPIISWTIRSPEKAALAMKYSDQITFEGFPA